MILNEFKINNPDYPLPTATLHITACIIEDADIPSGSGGINGENYTYGELRHSPIIPELMKKVTNLPLKQYVQACNERNFAKGFRMFKVEGEYCFWGLRIGPVVKVPTAQEMKQILLKHPKTAQAVKAHSVTATMVRTVTYDLLREELARQCSMSKEEAGLAIGNQLDCAPHEDISGYIFMVPN